MKNDDSGPAFPCEYTGFVRYANGSDGVVEVRHNGMSLRDYFIAHAPAEPQPWFEPVMTTLRPPNPGNMQNRWDYEYDKQRYIQWPAAWADAMLEARKK